MQFVTWMVNINGGLSFPITLEVVVIIAVVIEIIVPSSSDLKCYECGKPGHLLMNVGCELILKDLTVAAIVVVVELIPDIAGVQASIPIYLPL